jgi:hypothetical protein
MPLVKGPVCEICGTGKDVLCAPIMTGDKFGEPCQHPVCRECFYMWYESGETDAEKLKELVLAERAAKRFKDVIQESEG